jgi:hypothetical protein
MDDREKRLNFVHLGIFPKLKETEAIQLLEDITDLYYDAFPRTRYDPFTRICFASTTAQLALRLMSSN